VFVCFVGITAYCWSWKSNATIKCMLWSYCSLIYSRWTYRSVIVGQDQYRYAGI